MVPSYFLPTGLVYRVYPRASPLLSLWILPCKSEELTLGQLLICEDNHIKDPHWLNSQSSLFTTLFKPISTWSQRWKPEVVSFRNCIYVHSLQGLTFTSAGILSYKLLPKTNRKEYLSKGILAPISWLVWFFYRLYSVKAELDIKHSCLPLNCCVE